MKQHLMNLLLILSLSAIFSCKKDTPVQTEAQLTGQKLANLLGSSSATFTNGRVIYLLNNEGVIVFTATTYSISSDGYITVSGVNENPENYNLSFLKSYSVYPTGANNIELDFSF